MISPSRPRSRQVTLAVMRKRLERNTAVARSPARTVVARLFGGASGAGRDPDSRDPARPGARAYVRVGRVTNRVAEIDQEWQTLPGLAALQAKLGASRPRVPAGRGNSQPPTGKGWESHRQFEILGPRQLLFRESSFAEFSHHRLPHFLLRYRGGRTRRRLDRPRRPRAASRTRFRRRTRKPARINRQPPLRSSLTLSDYLPSWLTS